MDSLSFECRRQKKFQRQLEEEGFSLADDPANLYPFIGELREVRCYCDLYTPKLLAKLFPADLDREKHPEKFWLVPLWQIVKFAYVLPEPGETFTAQYVIGCRKISRDGYVPSLRLPLQ